MGLGYPVSCVIANGHTVPHPKFAMEYFSSHQNEPFAGALVTHLIDRIETCDLLAANRRSGEHLLAQLATLAAEFPLVASPRGKGLMCAFDLNVPATVDGKQAGDRFCAIAQENGLLIQHCNFGRTIRLLPNYLASPEDFAFLADRLRDTLATFQIFLDQTS